MRRHLRRVLVALVSRRATHHTLGAVHQHRGELGGFSRRLIVFAATTRVGGVRVLPRRVLDVGVGVVVSRLGGFRVRHHQSLDGEFAPRQLDDALLDGARGDELVHRHLALLSHAMRARLRLQIHERVEIRVVQDDGVGGGEVEPEPARARRHQHEKRARVRRVERLDQSLALRRRRAAVDSAVVELQLDAPTAANAGALDGGEAHAAEPKPILEDVEHARHLAEEQHAVTPGAKFREEFREELHLPGGGAQEDGVERPRRNRPEFRRSLARGGEFLLLRRRRRDVLGQPRFPRRPERVLLRRRKQKRMVAHLLQLFEDVEQGRALRRAHAVIHRAVILRQRVRVHLALKRRQLARHLHLSLLGQTLQHVLLQSAEHVLGQQRVEIAELSFGVRRRLLVLRHHLGVGGERLR